MMKSIVRDIDGSRYSLKKDRMEEVKTDNQPSGSRELPRWVTKKRLKESVLACMLDGKEPVTVTYADERGDDDIAYVQLYINPDFMLEYGRIKKPKSHDVFILQIGCVLFKDIHATNVVEWLCLGNRFKTWQWEEKERQRKEKECFKTWQWEEKERQRKEKECQRKKDERERAAYLSATVKEVGGPPPEAA